MNREIAVELLEETGICVNCAEDGIEAVNIINEAPEDKYDLVLMDIQMPKKNSERSSNLKTICKKSLTHMTTFDTIYQVIQYSMRE